MIELKKIFAWHIMPFVTLFFVIIPSILAAGLAGTLAYIMTASAILGYIIGVCAFSLAIYLCFLNIRH